MNHKIEQAIRAYEASMISDIRRLIQHNSAESEPLEGMPFGQGCADALNEALAIANELGFETKNLDNYAGFAQVGNGNELIGVICHVDVVPAGDGWTHDPFGGEISDGKLYGRGTTDDKGPAVAAMYAMKIVQDMGVPLNKRVRFFFGANEESGMQCARYYLEREGQFDYGFTPDGGFPVCFGEKGGFWGYFSAPISDEKAKVSVRSIFGGTAENVVSDKCVSILENTIYSDEIINCFKTFALEETLIFEIANTEQLTLTLYGTASHAACPELGVNANSHMMRFLANCPYVSCPFARGYNQAIGLSVTGANCGAEAHDEYGSLTFNVGILQTENGRVRGSLDVRFPVSITDFTPYVNNILSAFDVAGLTVDMHGIGEPLFIHPESPLITSLYDAYVKATGDTEHKPYTMGGGTYAKCFKNIVAFGPEFVDCEYNIHRADEFIPIEHLKITTKACVYALLNLLNMED